MQAAEGWQDTGLMERAFAYAKEILAEDPALEEHPLLKEDVAAVFAHVGDIMN